MHNFTKVIAFEVRRTLTRPAFWVATLAVPLFIGVLSGLMTLSTSQVASGSGGGTATRFTYTDASGLVSPSIAAELGGSPTSDAAAARADVVAGRADLHIDYPRDPASEPVALTARDRGLTGGDGDAALARRVLQSSAASAVGDPRLADVLRGPIVTEVRSYADGQEAPGIGSAILPGLFAVFFYLAIMMLGSQMLNITVEEKENRVTEMILTTIRPLTLIVGKIAALLVVGLVQAAVLTVPIVVALAVLSGGASAGSVPTLNGSPLVVDPARIGVAFALAILGFAMFTGLLVAIGSIMPNAKEASGAFGLVIVVLFLPLYAFGVLVSDPHGPASQALTFFPLTAPVAALVRNAGGLLGPAEAAGAIASISVAAVVFMMLGVHLFRTGSLSYDQRLRLRGLFRRSRRGRPVPAGSYTPPTG